MLRLFRWVPGSSRYLDAARPLRSTVLDRSRLCFERSRRGWPAISLRRPDTSMRPRPGCALRMHGSVSRKKAADSKRPPWLLSGRSSPEGPAMDHASLDYLERFFRYIVLERRLSPHTHSNYRRDLEELVSFCDKA